MITFSKYYYASLIIGTEQTNAVHYTAVNPGTGGNSIRIWHHNPGTPLQSLSVNVSGSDIEVSLETDGSSNNVSTPAQVEAIVNADPAASLLVSATADGSSVVSSNGTYASLSGGLDTVTFDILSPILGNRLSHEMRQAIGRSEGGQIYVYDKSAGPTYKLQLQFQYLDSDEATDLREFHENTVRGAMETFELEDWSGDKFTARFLTTELEFEEEAIDHYSTEFILEVDGLPSLTT